MGDNPEMDDRAQGLSRTARDLAGHDAEFGAAFRKFAGLDRQERVLSPKMRELIGFALAVSISHMDESAAAAHAAAARRCGASLDELRQASQMSMLLGIHSVGMVADFVVGQAGEQGARALTPDQEAIKQAYLRDRGFMPPPFENFIRLDAEFIDAYREISSLPFQRPFLSRKELELILVALDASINHLHAVGCQAHIQLAMAAGASAAEVAEVLELTASTAARGVMLGFRIAAEAFGGDEMAAD